MSMATSRQPGDFFCYCLVYIVDAMMFVLGWTTRATLEISHLRSHFGFMEISYGNFEFSVDALGVAEYC
jgi:hypothetical protein